MNGLEMSSPFHNVSPSPIAAQIFGGPHRRAPHTRPAAVLTAPNLGSKPKVLTVQFLCRDHRVRENPRTSVSTQPERSTTP